MQWQKMKAHVLNYVMGPGRDIKTYFSSNTKRDFYSDVYTIFNRI